MGQGQSSAESSEPALQDVAVKRDYYELLGVERTATEDGIKKAYRRKALELHPDRNYGNVEDATKLFAEISSAYEVLSDPQERAWYDSHRDVLLRGDPVGGQEGEEFSYNIKMTTADEVLKLMMKFNGRLDFSDAPGGFYGGLDEYFKKLAKEEDIACQWEDEDPLDYPEFGSKSDDYDEVVRPFYSAWTGFATRKSYAWKDQYRLSDAPDRRIRRLMEKENSKLREEAKQEYNEAVRVLVAFVRKRDPRVQNNKKSEAERQKALKEAAAAQAARSRAAQQAKIEELENYVVPEWARSRTQDEHEGGFSSESEVEEHEYDCVVCDKTFKSEAQFQAHEKSKKHVKLLKQLKREMEAEGHILDLKGKSEHDIETIDEGDDEDTLADSQNDLEKDNKTDVPSDQEINTTKLKAKSTHSSNPDTASPQSEDLSDTSEDSGSDYASRAAVAERITGADTDTGHPSNANTIPNLTSTLEGTNLSTPITSDTEISTSKPKLNKAKLKRAKKAAAATIAAETGADGSGEFECAVCAADFASKTKLFTHIKEKGHAAPLGTVKGGMNGTTTGKTKGKGKKR